MNNDKNRWMGWTAALSTHGQESEAQAVGYMYRYEFGGETVLGFVEPDCECEKLPVFLSAPPSALAIESAAKRQAAEVCRCEFNHTVANKILATIPQDGITALERFAIECMSKAVLLVEHDYYPPEEDLLKIVSSLIGEK